MQNKLQAKTNSEKIYEEMLKPHKNLIIENLKLVVQDKVPESSKELASVMSIGKLSSHLRILGEKEDGEIIPSNVYGILMAGSGSGKDKAINAMNRALKGSYDAIRKKLEDEEEQRARQEAIYEYNAEAEKEDKNLYKKFLKPIPSFTGDTGTPEGVMRRLHNFSKYSFGGGMFTETEFASKLKSGGRITESLRLLAEGFDGGNFESKTVSGDASAMPPLDSMSCCLYLFTDPFSIMTDPSLKQKYREEMTQRYARRSFFLYEPDDMPPVDIVDYNSFADDYRRKIIAKEKASLTFDKFNKLIATNTFCQKVMIPDDVWMMFELAVKAWDMKKSRLDDRQQILRKSYQDVAWRGFKLGIALAGLENSELMTKKYFEQGLYYSERLFRTIERFEADIALEDFERLAQYIENNTKNDNSVAIRQSELVKMGLISAKTSNSIIGDLVTMTSSVLPRHNLEYDKETGTIEATEYSNDGELGVSILKWDANNIPRTKEERRDRSKSGYKYVKSPFSMLSTLLSNTCAFVPFKLENGVLLKENVIGGTKFIIFDVDESDVTYKEMSDELSDFTHHIATTSDRENPYKFRILIELDSVIDLDRRVWMKTITSLAKWIGIEPKIDTLHKTQTTYGYAGADVVSVVAEPLKATVIMEIASEVFREQKKKEESKSTKAKTSKVVVADYRGEAKAFLGLMHNGAGRNLTLYKFYKYLTDYTDDMDWIADVAIQYLYDEFLTSGGEGIGFEKFEMIQQQIKDSK